MTRPRPRIPTAVLGLSAFLLAAVLLLREWEKRHASAERPAPGPVPTTAAAAGTASEPAAEMPSPAARSVTLPKPGPSEAVSASVGNPRAAGRAAAEEPSATEVRGERRGATETEVVPRPATASSLERVDAVYSTRRSVRFTSSPDQARLTIDGRLVGIADDWDNRGGGRAFEFDRPGAHFVRMELPGYRPVRLRIDVSADSEKDSVSIDEELERREKLPYEKLPSVADRTTAAVEFAVDPPDALLSEGGKTFGPASSFGPGSPLALRGPAVHNLVLTAPGCRPKVVRVLVASNAERDRARIREKLKRE